MKTSLAYLKNVFIDETDLPTPPATAMRVQSLRVPGSTDDKGEAQLCGGTPCYFAPSVSGENKQAVSNCVQFAQRAANAQVPQGKKGTTMEWYNAFLDVLQHLGWSKGSFEFSEVEAHGSTFSINSAFVKMISDFVLAASLHDSKKIIDGINSMFNALESDRSENYSRLYSHFHQHARQNVFDTGIVTQDPDEDPLVSVPILVFFVFEMSMDVPTLQILWTRYESSSVQARAAQNQMILNKSIYLKIRETIEERLGSQSKNYVRDIALD